MGTYNKALAMVAVTIATALASALGDHDHITTLEWVQVAIIAVGALQVGVAANLTTGPWRYTKSILAALAAALVFISGAVIDGGMSVQDWMNTLIAAAGAVGVFAIPNAGVTRRVGVHRSGEPSAAVGDTTL